MFYQIYLSQNNAKIQKSSDCATFKEQWNEEGELSTAEILSAQSKLGQLAPEVKRAFTCCLQPFTCLFGVLYPRNIYKVIPGWILTWTVCTHGEFIMSRHWETRPLAPWLNAPLSHDIELTAMFCLWGCMGTAFFCLVWEMEHSFLTISNKTKPVPLDISLTLYPSVFL